MNKLLLYSLCLMTIAFNSYATEAPDPRMKDIKIRQNMAQVKQDITELQKITGGLLAETVLRPEGLLLSEGFDRTAYILPHAQALLCHTNNLNTQLLRLALYRTDMSSKEKETREELTSTTLVNLLGLQDLIDKITEDIRINNPDNPA